VRSDGALLCVQLRGAEETDPYLSLSLSPLSLLQEAAAREQALAEAAAREQALAEALAEEKQALAEALAEEKQALAEEKQALAEEKQAHAKTRAHAAVYITFCIALFLCLGQHAKTRAHVAVYIIHILYCLAFWVLVNLCAFIALNNIIILRQTRTLRLKEISTLVAIPRHLHLVLASRKL
jgi:hypothetical protein